MIIEIREYENYVSVQEQTVLYVTVVEHNIPPGISQSAFTGKGVILVGTGVEVFAAFEPGVDGEFLQYASEEAAGMKSAKPTLEVNDAENRAFNGGFNIAQRLATPGTLTTISDGAYGPDRWKCYRENADLQYRRVDASGESDLTSPYYGEFKKITNAGKFLICQPLEYLDTVKFRGRSISFQIKMKSNAARTMKIAIGELQSGGTLDAIPAVVSAWNADETDPTLGANLAVISTPVSCSVTNVWQNFQFTGTFPTTSKNLLLLVWSDADVAANDTLAMAEAGLFLGSQILAWTPSPFVLELSACYRYYYLHCRGANKHISIGILYSATQLNGEIKFPVSMRVPPSLDAATGTDYYRMVRNSSVDNFNSLTLVDTHENGTFFNNTTEISGTAGQAGIVETLSASAYVGFNAEL